VLVTSGYNNVNVPAKAGDGKGYLYVLDASTGKLLKKISTGVGDATTPSGLSNIRNWTLADASVNATTTLVYGADLLGNIFRFDINSASPAATLVTTLKDPSGNPQPITTRLGLAEVGTPPSPYIFAATGRYLGTSDVADNQVQSVYGIKDTGAVISNPRSTLMKLSISTSAGARHISCGSNCTSQAGWMVDLPDAGERVSVDMQLQFGMLVVGSNVPSNTACSPGGYSWVNYFDMQSGLSPFGVGQTMGYSLTSMLVGLTIVKLPNDQPKGFARGSDGTTSGIDIPPLFSGGGKRVSWREIGK
jgi:Tfp pilus tip-associated adhesin PilY1